MFSLQMLLQLVDSLSVVRKLIKPPAIKKERLGIVRFILRYFCPLSQQSWGRGMLNYPSPTFLSVRLEQRKAMLCLIPVHWMGHIPLHTLPKDYCLWDGGHFKDVAIKYQMETHCWQFRAGNVLCNLIADHFPQEMSHAISLQTTSHRKCLMQSHNRPLPTGNVSCNLITNHIGSASCNLITDHLLQEISHVIPLQTTSHRKWFM